MTDRDGIRSVTPLTWSRELTRHYPRSASKLIQIKMKERDYPMENKINLYSKIGYDKIK